MGILVDAIRKVNNDVDEYKIKPPDEYESSTKRLAYVKGFRDGQNFVIDTFNKRFEEILSKME